MVRIDMFRQAGVPVADGGLDGLAALLSGNRHDAGKTENDEPSPFQELLARHAEAADEAPARAAGEAAPEAMAVETGKPAATVSEPRREADERGIDQRERPEKRHDKAELVSMAAVLVMPPAVQAENPLPSSVREAQTELRQFRRATARGGPPEKAANRLADLLDRVPTDRGQKETARGLMRRWREVAAGVAEKTVPAARQDGDPGPAAAKRPAVAEQGLAVLMDATANLLRQVVQANSVGEPGTGNAKPVARGDEARRIRTERAEGPRIEVVDLRANDPRRLAGASARRIAATREARDNPVATPDPGKPGLSPEQKQAQGVSPQEGASSLPRASQSGPASVGTTPLPLRSDFAARVAEAAKAAVAAEPRAVFHQIVERARLTLKSGMSEMQLDLKPESLGRVRMNLLLSEGGVQAKLTVADEGLRQFLHGHLDQLGEELRAAGINLTGLELAQHGSGETGSRAQEQARHGIGPADSGADPLSGTVHQGPDTVRQERHQGAVDLIA